MKFNDFASTCERLAATTKKIEKATILKEYFSTLSDEDLILSSRFFAGRPFALVDERVLNIGWAVVRDVVCALAGISGEEFGALTTKMGEPGSAAEIALAPYLSQTSDLTLSAVLSAFSSIVTAKGPSAKRPLLQTLLQNSTPSGAKYIIKIMGGDLRIGLQEGQLEDALARYSGNSVADVQAANMLLGDIGETALLARQMRLSDAKMRLFHPLKFMLASPIQEMEEIRRSIPALFFVEDKYDGIRAQVHKDGERLAIFSRTLDEITHRFPELAEPLQTLPGSFILDGEILAAREGRILPFKELQARLGRKSVSALVRETTPVIFVVYDILYRDNSVLLTTPLEERRSLLEQLLAALGPESTGLILPSLLVRCLDTAEVDPLFVAARARGNEGLMVKDPASVYKPGRRGREWLKVKKAYATLDVVVTAVEVGNGKRRDVLSDYTFAVRASESDPTLLNIGKAYSGLTDLEISTLTEWFKEHTLQNFGRVRLVEPSIVLEVAFDIVQPSPRHKSGFALRFPRIARLRPDKTRAEIDTLDTVKALAAGDPGIIPSE